MSEELVDQGRYSANFGRLIGTYPCSHGRTVFITWKLAQISHKVNLFRHYLNPFRPEIIHFIQ